MNLAVRGARVLVEVEDQTETVLPSGVIAVERPSPPTVGRVVAVGETQDVQIGDVVVFGREVGMPVPYDGAQYLVMHEGDISAIWEAEGHA